MSGLDNAGRRSASGSPNRRPRGRLAAGLTLMGLVVALLWVLEIVDQSTGNSLDTYGIEPRTADGLWRILTAPFLHYGWDHLIANTVPLFVLGMLICLSSVRELLVATAASVVGSGLLVWLIAPGNSITAGASGVVFGLLSYLLVRGFFTRRPGQILLALGVLAVYGSVLFGVLPGQDGVSWQAHLGGAVGGVLAAWLSGRRRDGVPGRTSPQRRTG